MDEAMKDLPPGLLDEAVSRLKQEFHPEAIYLFGSHAWGEPTEDSDVDFMVIVREDDRKPRRRMQRAHQCLAGLGVPKDILVPSLDEWNRYRHLRSSLFHMVSAKGRKLYG